MKKKYALALSGGGFKGAYQLGALRYIRENWKEITGQPETMHFDIVAGVSVGALNGALIASQQFEALEQLWKEVYEHGGEEIYTSGYINNDGKIRLRFDQLQKDLLPDFKVNAGSIAKGLWNSLRRTFDKNVPGLVATLLKAAEKDFNKNFPHFKALASNKPLEEKLRSFLDLQKIPEDTAYLCGLVSINDGLYYSLSNNDFKDNENFVQAVLASSSMPIIWEPRPLIAAINPERIIKNAVDGGIRNISPLGDIVDHINADPDKAEYEIMIINCNSGYITPMDEQWNIGDIALRTLTEITLAEIFSNDINQFLKANDLVRQATAENLKLKHKNDVLKEFAYTLIQPVRDELGDTMDSRSAIIQGRETYGYEQAKAAFGLEIAKGMD
jgi:NTE family protein